MRWSKMRRMPTRTRQAPRPAGVRWRSVRGGLTLFAVVWTLLTIVAASSRAWSILAAQQAVGEGAELAAAFTFMLFGLASQAIYSLSAVLLGVSAVHITRAPVASGAVTPALVGAVGFGALALSVLTLLSAATTPDDERQLSSGAISGFWIAAIALRTLAVAGVCLALVRLARHLGEPLPRALVGALFALLAVDAASAFHGLRAEIPVAARWALLALQLALGALLVLATLSVRKRVQPLAEKEPRREKPPPQPRDELPSSEPALQQAPVEPEISPAARLLAALLTAIGVGALPIWDALDPRMRFEIDGPSPMLAAGIALVGGFAALLVHQALAENAYRARLIVAAAAAVGVGYAAMTLYTTALQRSKLVDQFPICESGESPAEPMSRPLLSPVEGPRLAGGSPCTRAAERRAEHREAYPDGSFQDGVVQIGRRFVADRPRLLGGSAAALLALLVASVLVFRAAGEEDEDEDEDEDGTERRAGKDPQVPE
jgi:hypothetical protein